MAAKKLSFEQSLGRIDEIVRHLENGEMPLADSLKLFEEATGLINSCGRMLDEAEQTVVKLRRGADGEALEEAFEEE